MLYALGRKKGKHKMQIETHSENETYELALQLGSNATKGALYTLSGDLGVGKTVFTKGFAKGLAITEPVNSPTFTIVQVYDTGRMPLYHFDVYRISDIDEMYEIGYEDYVYGNGVTLIEWANLIQEILPDKRTEITITKDVSKGFEYRKIEIITTGGRENGENHVDRG